MHIPYIAKSIDDAQNGEFVRVDVAGVDSFGFVVDGAEGRAGKGLISFAANGVGLVTYRHRQGMLVLSYGNDCHLEPAIEDHALLHRRDLGRKTGWLTFNQQGVSLVALDETGGWDEIVAFDLLSGARDDARFLNGLHFAAWSVWPSQAAYHSNGAAPLVSWRAQELPDPAVR